MKYSYDDLKKAYEDAKAESKEQFKFLGKYDILVAYAKYLLEHLEGLLATYSLKKSDKVFHFTEQKRSARDEKSGSVRKS